MKIAKHKKIRYNKGEKKGEMMIDMKYIFGEEDMRAIQAARRKNRDKNAERRLWN